MFKFKISADDVPDTFDWRDKGAISPVKDMGNCQITGTFSLASLYEHAFFLRDNKIVDLSEQFLLQCDKDVPLNCKDNEDTDTAQDIVN